RFELALDLGDAFLNKPSVRLDLRFAGTAEKTEAAALTLQMGPAPHQAAFLIVEVSKLDLQRAFARMRAFTENFENKPRPVEDLEVPRLFEVALLHGAEMPIDNDESGFEFFEKPLQLLNLAFADQCGGARLRNDGNRLAHDFQIYRRRKPRGLFQARSLRAV